MISYEVIREGIASAIMKAFPRLPIDDEDSHHLDGPSFLVQLTDNSHRLDDLRTVRRVMEFSVVYFAPLHTEKAKVLSDGLRLAGALQPSIAFGDRVITVNDVSTKLIDMDFQVEFTLDFYDELHEREKIDYMNVLDFKITLESKGVNA